MRSALAAAALLAALLAGPSSAGDGDVAAEAPAPPGARVMAGGRHVVLTGAAACRIALEDWRNGVSAAFDEAFPEPPRIGDQPKRPADFGRFGAAARAGGHPRAVVSTSTYAILTTLSLLTVVDLEGCAMRLVPAVYRGEVNEVVFSSDARRVAFTLATARAAGESLAVVDAAAAEPAFTIGREELHAALTEARPGTGRGGDPNDFTPHVRDLAWDERGEALRFSSDRPGTGGPDAPARSEPLRWRVEALSGALELLGGGRPEP